VARRVDEHQRAVGARALADTPRKWPGQPLDHLLRQRRQRLRYSHGRHPSCGRAVGGEFGDQRCCGRSPVDGRDHLGGGGGDAPPGRVRRPRSPGRGPWPRSGQVASLPSQSCEPRRGGTIHALWTRGGRCRLGGGRAAGPAPKELGHGGGSQRGCWHRILASEPHRSSAPGEGCELVTTGHQCAQRSAS
jgi:hypothetical protein